MNGRLDSVCYLAQNTHMSIFGDNLRARRLALGMTQTELARRAGIGRTNIPRIEAGKYEPQVSDAGRLAKVLGVTVDELLSAKSNNDVAECNKSTNKHTARQE